MKKDWKIKTLAEVCDIKPPKSEARAILDDQDLVSFVPMEDLGILSKEFSTPKERVLKDVSGSYTYFADGDVLMAKITPCFENGKLGIARNLKNGVGFGSSEFVVFRTKLDILSDYLFYQLTSDNFREEGKKVMSGAVGHKRVPKEYIENYKIMVPPVAKQKRIAGILDEKFKAIEELKKVTEAQIQDAKELFESRVSEIFDNVDGEKKILGDVCDLKNGYAFKSGDYVKSSNTLNIRMSNIRPGGYFDAEHNQRFLPDIYAKEFEGFLLKEGDLIIAMTDMAGKPKILAIPTLVSGLKCKNFLLNQRVGKLTDYSKSVYVPFLRYFLSSTKTRDYLQSKGVKGVQINLSKSEILNTPLKLPSITIQNDFVTEIDCLSEKTQELVQLFQSKISSLEELKKSYLEQAFAGKL